MSNWNKCSDGLPEIGKPILIIVEGKILKRTYFIDIVDCAESYRFFVYNFDLDESDDYELLCRVSHYMYLEDIEPPKE